MLTVGCCLVAPLMQRFADTELLVKLSVYALHILHFGLHLSCSHSRSEAADAADAAPSQVTLPKHIQDDRFDFARSLLESFFCS